MIETPWMTTEEAADYLRTNRRVLEQWARRGVITRWYPGGIRSPRYHKDNLDALMVPHTPDTTEDAPATADE